MCAPRHHLPPCSACLRAPCPPLPLRSRVQGPRCPHSEPQHAHTPTSSGVSSPAGWLLSGAPVPTRQKSNGWRQQLLGVGSAPCHKNEQEASWQDHRFRDCKIRRTCKNTRGDTKGSRPPGRLLAPSIAPPGNHASEDNKCRLRARRLPPGMLDTNVSRWKLRNFKRTSLEECES